jgi:hypothetical protein
MPLRKPVSFREAEAYLTAKADRPTALNSRQYLTMWDKDARQRAFFSANVASADILAALHKATQAVVDGMGTEAQAVDWMRTFLETDGAAELARGGWATGGEAGNRLTELASKRRLELIVYQNVKIAQETGAYQQWAATRDVHPYGRWRLGRAEEHREEHVARDGNVYAFDHPIWTESPPGSEFNCRCWRELMTAAEARADGVTIEPLDSPFIPGTVDFDPAGGLDIPPPVKPDLPPDVAAALRKALGMPAEEPTATVPAPMPPPADLPAALPPLPQFPVAPAVAALAPSAPAAAIPLPLDMPGTVTAATMQSAIIAYAAAFGEVPPGVGRSVLRYMLIMQALAAGAKIAS